MDNTLYDICFRGGLMPGADLNTVRSNMASLFKLADVNDPKIAAMFSGRVVILKKGIDKQSALKYQAVLEKSGAKVILKEKAASSTTQSTATLTTERSIESTPQTQSPPPEQQSWDVAATGSDLLKPGEKTPFTAVEVDTSAIKLAPVSPFERNETPPPPPPKIDHISMAEAGSDLLTEKTPEPPEPDIDLSHLNIEPQDIEPS